MHCLLPIGVHGNSVSCSCNSAGFPVGGSDEPFLNWPVKNTPQVHDVCSALWSVNPSGNSDLNFTNSFSRAVFACDPDDDSMLITQNAINTNWDTSISIPVVSFFLFEFTVRCVTFRIWNEIWRAHQTYTLSESRWKLLYFFNWSYVNDFNFDGSSVLLLNIHVLPCYCFAVRKIKKHIQQQ